MKIWHIIHNDAKPVAVELWVTECNEDTIEFLLKPAQERHFRSRDCDKCYSRCHQQLSVAGLVAKAASPMQASRERPLHVLSRAGCMRWWDAYSKHDLRRSWGGMVVFDASSLHEASKSRNRSSTAQAQRKLTSASYMHADPATAAAASAAMGQAGPSLQVHLVPIQARLSALWMFQQAAHVQNNV